MWSLSLSSWCPGKGGQEGRTATVPRQSGCQVSPPCPGRGLGAGAPAMEQPRTPGGRTVPAALSARPHLGGQVSAPGSSCLRPEAWFPGRCSVRPRPLPELPSPSKLWFPLETCLQRNGNLKNKTPAPPALEATRPANEASALRRPAVCAQGGGASIPGAECSLETQKPAARHPRAWARRSCSL